MLVFVSLSLGAYFLVVVSCRAGATKIWVVRLYCLNTVVLYP